MVSALMSKSVSSTKAIISPLNLFLLELFIYMKRKAPRTEARVTPFKKSGKS